MARDIKDIVGILMRVLDGAEISDDDLNDLGFEADGELETALNEAYVKLREFTNDRDRRRTNAERDRSMRSELQACLDSIVNACNPAKSAMRN